MFCFCCQNPTCEATLQHFSAEMGKIHNENITYQSNIFFKTLKDPDQLDLRPYLSNFRLTKTLLESCMHYFFRGSIDFNKRSHSNLFIIEFKPTLCNDNPLTMTPFCRSSLTGKYPEGRRRSLICSL